MIDYIFLLLITVCAVITPLNTDYKQLNILLVAKFCFFIGIHEVTIGLGAVDGAWVDMYRIGLDACFAILFLMAGGSWLFFLCVVMAFFHIFNTFVPYDYRLVIIGFQVLQLGSAIWGMTDGVVDRISNYFSRRGTSDRRTHLFR